jgi:hypothetical protein
VAGLFVALVHFPVTDRNGRIVTSAITSLDLHDIARSSRTFGVNAFFVVHPIPDQRTFAASVIDHWQTRYGRQFDSRRREALDLIRVVPNLDEAIVEIEGMEGARPTIVYTSARALAESEGPREAPPAFANAATPTPAESSQEPGCTTSRTARLGYADLRARLERSDKPPVLLLFGTGFGMAPAVLERADFALPPVFGPGEYNHLSVRAAAGIILDRLRGH